LYWFKNSKGGGIGLPGCLPVSNQVMGVIKKKNDRLPLKKLTWGLSSVAGLYYVSLQVFFPAKQGSAGFPVALYRNRLIMQEQLRRKLPANAPAQNQHLHKNQPATNRLKQNPQQK